MPPRPKILSNLSASQNGTPNTVNNNCVIDTSNLLYSLEDVITGLDFNPTGEYVATIDERCVCLISEVNTVNYKFHKRIGEHIGKFDS